MQDNFLSEYMRLLSCSVEDMRASLFRGRPVSVAQAMDKVLKRLCVARERGKKVIFIGNGGSASIASHQSVDYWKNGGIRSVCFSDPSWLTCLSNDYGYERVFSKAVEMFAEKGDMLLAVSSSGRSKNIINAAACASKMGVFVVTLSGFGAGNTLRKRGDVNFYVPSMSYGVVEIAHLAICHSLLDYIMASQRH